jgi:hypothetical protein
VATSRTGWTEKVATSRTGWTEKVATSRTEGGQKKWLHYVQGGQKKNTKSSTAIWTARTKEHRTTEEEMEGPTSS